MKKIAIFVEGMTEQELVVWLVKSIASAVGLQVVLGKQFGGKVNISTAPAELGISFYVLVVDCSCDEQVKTQIKEAYPTLIIQGFTHIIGLRDVYPMNLADVPSIKAHLMAGLPTDPVVPKIHLALMEVEAWFIGETTHFPRLDPDLTIAEIIAGGFPIDATNIEAWPNPAATLHQIYKIKKLAYKKKKAQVQRTIAALSYNQISTTVRNGAPALNEFLFDVENALILK